MKKFLKDNSLSIVFFFLFVFSLAGQAVTELKEHNSEMQEEGRQVLTISQYLFSGHFLQATFENWESEFFSVFAIVILSIFLREQGSPQSKPVDAPNSETGG